MRCSPFPFVWAFRRGLGAILGEKWLFLAQNCTNLGGHLPTWHHLHGPPPVTFWLKNLIWQGHHVGSKRWDGAMAKMAWGHALLLVVVVS